MTFSDGAPLPGEKKSRKTPPRSTSGAEILQHELTQVRDDLQTTVENLQGSNEELKSMNEELQSTNEELQSTNEELETAKEETQSLNEELESVNAELQGKVDQLERSNDDLDNLLNSTEIATLFLGDDLAIRRFTEAIQPLIRLIPSDVGRPVTDLVTTLEDVDLASESQTALTTGVPVMREIRAASGSWYLMRIKPYVTTEGMVDGVLVTFVKVSGLRSAEAAQRFTEGIVQNIREPILVLDASYRIVAANRSFCSRFGLDVADVAGQSLYEIQDKAWDLPALRKLLEQVLPHRRTIEDFQVGLPVPDQGLVTSSLNARRLESAGNPDMLMLTLKNK